MGAQTSQLGKTPFWSRKEGLKAKKDKENELRDVGSGGVRGRTVSVGWLRRSGVNQFQEIDMTKKKP